MVRCTSQRRPENDINSGLEFMSQKALGKPKVLYWLLHHGKKNGTDGKQPYKFRTWPLRLIPFMNCLISKQRFAESKSQDLQKQRRQLMQFGTRDHGIHATSSVVKCRTSNSHGNEGECCWK